MQLELQTQPQSQPPALPEPGLTAAVTAAVVGALVASGLGTVLHAQLFTAGSWTLPAGAFAALIFSGSVALFSGMWAGRAWVTALTGVLTYVLVGIFATGRSGSILIMTGDARGMDLVTAAAGSIWIYGIAVVTVAAVLVAVKALHYGRRRRP